MQNNLVVYQLFSLPPGTYPRDMLFRIPTEFKFCEKHNETRTHWLVYSLLMFDGLNCLAGDVIFEVSSHVVDPVKDLSFSLSKERESWTDDLKESWEMTKSCICPLFRFKNWSNRSHKISWSSYNHHKNLWWNWENILLYHNDALWYIEDVA